MFATRNDKTITLSNDITKAMVGIKEGYKVTIHAKPEYLFLVDAETTDKAHAAVITLLKSEGIKCATGATIQRIA